MSLCVECEVLVSNLYLGLSFVHSENLSLVGVLRPFSLKVIIGIIGLIFAPVFPSFSILLILLLELFPVVALEFTICTFTKLSPPSDNTIWLHV